MNTPHSYLDTQGLRCPDPIMMIRKQLRSMQVDEVLEVLADDLSTTWDIPRFCLHLNHVLISSQTQTPPFVYLIKKGQ